jgi:tetratricopeptide (TPR) repeat protein
LKRYEAAEQAFSKVCELAPDQSIGYRSLAELYLDTNRNLPEALSLAEKAVRIDPTAVSYYVLSEAYDKNGDRPGAIAAMERAVQLDPDNTRYRRIYGILQQGN